MGNEVKRGFTVGSGQCLRQFNVEIPQYGFQNIPLKAVSVPRDYFMGSLPIN